MLACALVYPAGPLAPTHGICTPFSFIGLALIAEVGSREGYFSAVLKT
jgi:hypothetical protein